jgi:hypothetical protein
MIKYKVFRDSEAKRLRKVVIEIWKEQVLPNGQISYSLLDRTRMFGNILHTERAIERLRMRIYRRLVKRIAVATVFDKAGNM